MTVNESESSSKMLMLEYFVRIIRTLEGVDAEKQRYLFVYMEI